MVIAAAAVLLSGDHHLGDLLGASPADALGPANVSAPTARPFPPTRLVALPASTITNGTQSLSVTLTAPVSPSSPPPTLRPAVAGAWATVGNSEVFTPVSTLEPCSTYTLTVWAGTTSTGHSSLGRRRTLALHVSCPSITGLQQALARLGYLGAVFHSLYGVRIASGPETRREAAVHAFHPPRGRLAPDPSDAPSVATGHLDETTKGALTVYQSDRGLEATGEPNYPTWASLLASETAYRHNRSPYTWVSVSESIPETLEVHRGDHVALTTPVNTGVAGAATQTGIFPIYSRLTSTTMTGTNPDGTKYSDPGVPWVNYFNGGDAVHGFPRASYGSPQSNGCVELPIETAHTVFGMLAIGDIVDVSG
jgi:peptidoglycan hydrolase-like protein with peptidoglycan-binding domain